MKIETMSPGMLRTSKIYGRDSSCSGRYKEPLTQRGVVLIIALIMLVIISLLATLSMRNATSTESVSGNVRTTQLATQAAEIALRYCEAAVVQINGGPGSLVSLPAIQDYRASPLLPLWQDTANWDSATSVALVVPTASVNQAGAGATFKRAPECMVERMPMVSTAGALTTTSTYVITARGFGPEVAADAARGRPTGSEVWMQSTIELN
jgi:type IV pilus assembly protein PilX